MKVRVNFVVSCRRVRVELCRNRGRTPKFFLLTTRVPVPGKGSIGKEMFFILKGEASILVHCDEEGEDRRGTVFLDGGGEEADPPSSAGATATKSEAELRGALDLSKSSSPGSPASPRDPLDKSEQELRTGSSSASMSHSQHAIAGSGHDSTSENLPPPTLLITATEGKHSAGNTSPPSERTFLEMENENHVRPTESYNSVASMAAASMAAASMGAAGVGSSLSMASLETQPGSSSSSAAAGPTVPGGTTTKQVGFAGTNSEQIPTRSWPSEDLGINSEQVPTRSWRSGETTPPTTDSFPMNHVRSFGSQTKTPTLIKLLSSGDHFGEFALITHQRRAAWVRANCYSVGAAWVRAN